MSQASGWESPWLSVLEQMFDELRSAEPRAQSYWAQQLAFAPVFMHAVTLALHRGAITQENLDQLREVLPVALSLLGALPDGCAGDPHSFFLLAHRQATALAWGRRRHLTRLAERLGLEASSFPDGPIPRRFQRPYELIGWRPPQGSPAPIDAGRGSG